MVASEEGKTLTYRMWHMAVHNALIQQGLHGVRESALKSAFKDVHEDELVGYLELLLKEDKVQKFRYMKHVYWRATVNILNEEYRREG